MRSNAILSKGRVEGSAFMGKYSKSVSQFKNASVSAIFLHIFSDFKSRSSSGIAERSEEKYALADVLSKKLITQSAIIAWRRESAFSFPERSSVKASPKSVATPIPLAVIILPSSTMFLSFGMFAPIKYSSKPG